MAVFATSNFKIFRGSMPPDPLAGSPFGRGSHLRPLNFRTQVPTFRTQVETGLGKTLKKHQKSSRNDEERVVIHRKNRKKVEKFEKHRQQQKRPEVIRKVRKDRKIGNLNNRQKQNVGKSGKSDKCRGTSSWHSRREITEVEAVLVLTF